MMRMDEQAYREYRVKQQFGNASEIVETTPTLTDVVESSGGVGAFTATEAETAKARTAGKLTLILPFPPTYNTAVRHTKTGHHYRTPEFESYRSHVADSARILRVARRDGPLSVKAHFWMPDARKRDLDNVWKTLADAMQDAGVYVNDSQIEHLELRKAGIAKPGSVRVDVEAA